MTKQNMKQRRAILAGLGAVAAAGAPPIRALLPPWHEKPELAAAPWLPL